jgi:WS/DGAT/MGAT family acyltransferase
MAAMTTVAALFDPDPQVPPSPEPPWTPAPPPSDRDLFADAVRRRLAAARRAASPLLRPVTTLRRARQGWPAIRELLAEQPATRTSLDRTVGPDRTLAVVRTTLDDVRAAAHAHDATVNDVLLAVTAAGLRAVLHGRGEPIERITLRTYVPISLRLRHRSPDVGSGRGAPPQGNRIAQMAVPLPMREADAGEELRRLVTETAARKAKARASLDTFVRGGLVGRLVLIAVMRQRVNITTANLPGPTRALHLCGARVLEAFPVLPLVADEPLGVGALSYAGRFDIGVVADAAVCPDLDRFLAGACERLQALGIPAHPMAATEPTRSGGTR